MTKIEFAEIMAVLESGTGKPLKADQLPIWFECLKDIPVNVLRGACVDYLQSGDDWPSIAKLRRFAGCPDPDVRAEKAWECVRASIRRHGAYSTVEFDDPVIHATVRSLGGWEPLCGHSADELKWVRKDFVKTYMALVATSVDAHECRPLVGIVDRLNHEDGRGASEVKRIATGMTAPNVRMIGHVESGMTGEAKRLASSFDIPELEGGS